MNTETASALIRRIWDIGEQLKAAQRELDAIEGVIADEVPGDD